MPRISVLLPYRDEALYIDDCLRSLARQTEKDFELICVDDGSTDDSPRRVEARRGDFARLVHLHTGGTGLVEALNLGLSKASGEIIARADGDDLYAPRRLELQRNLIDAGVDMAGTKVRFFPRRSVMGGFKVYESWINRLVTPTAIASEIFVEAPLAHPSLTFRRDLIDRIGPYRDLGWPEDYDLMLRAHRAGAVFGKTDRVLLYWREHPDRACRRDPRYRSEAFIDCRCHHLARGPLARDRRIALWGAGPIGRKMATHLRRHGIDFEAYVDIDPRKIGRTVRDRPVQGPELLKGKRHFVLSCVGKRNARYLVRADLTALGYRERLDFLLAA